MLRFDEIKKKRSDDKTLIRYHHILMKEYGWIPFEEFKKLPIPTVMNLLGEIESDWKETEKQYRKMKHGRR